MDITLQFTHCRCGLAPISHLHREEFPRVRSLVLCLGDKDPEEPNMPYVHECVPSAEFFRPFVNRLSFPDLKDFTLRHHWAITPPAHTTLDIQYHIQHQGRLHPARNHRSNVGSIGDPGGLDKLESIMLEAVPEFTPPVLTQLLGNPLAATSNLTNLDIRFCEVDHSTIAQLLHHAPPKLKRLCLMSRLGDREARLWDRMERRTGPSSTCASSHHLCPLLREYSKRLERLDYGALSVCRELFFSDDEILSLPETQSRNLDVYAIQQTIQAVRKHRKARQQNDRIQKTLQQLDLSTKSFDSTHSSVESATTTAASSKAQMDVEAALDEEEAQRQRFIDGSRAKWTRRIIAFGGTCNKKRNDSYSWDELKIAADMEEKGVHWLLASMSTYPTKPTSARFFSQ